MGAKGSQTIITDGWNELDIMTTLKNIHLFYDQKELFNAAAFDFKERAIHAVAKQGRFTVALSGGDTPKHFFNALIQIKNDIPWEKIQFYFGDERYVSWQDAESNYKNAYDYLFSKLPIQIKNIYPIPTNLSDPNEAAKIYAKTLCRALPFKKNKLPFFDLIYLGLGDDAHTASLMPSSELVKLYSKKPTTHINEESLVASVWVPALNMYRITLTPPMINNSDMIIFMVTGIKKQYAVHNVLEGSYDPIIYPAQLIHDHDKNVWYLDKLAAAQLSIIRD